MHENRVVELREATAEDADFLLDMLVEASNWSGEERIGRSAVLRDPQLHHYVSAWPRADDFGVVAMDRDRAVGAAWARRFSARDPGYGFVAPDVPELSMAVVSAQRGRGIGRRMLESMIELARRRGCRALSLSVEDGNRVARLYRAVGFRPVGRHGNSETMLLELHAPPR
jgi:GNAT superfamily N-acetyltransferase